MIANLEGLELSCDRMFDEVPCYISVQDQQFRVLRANRTLTNDFGESVSRYCYEAYKGRQSRCPECPVARTFEDGKEHSSEEILFDRRGLPHDVIVRTRPLRNRAGEIAAVMELFSDITVQKELEHRLHDSLTRFHNLFDVVPCYISVQDRDLRVMEANDRFKESFGNRLGVHCYEIYKRRGAPCPECPVMETFADGKSHTGEHLWIDSAGRQVHVVVYTAPILDARGRIVDVMEVSADITEIRALQDKLASLGRLVGGIAHSIKNILEGLRGGVYIVNLGFRDNNQEDIRTGWEMVQRNVGRISNMIMDMLHCARERSPRRLPVDLCQVAREVTGLFETRAKDRGVRLETELPADGAGILGEPKDIHSLLANLVTNAIDACAEDEDASKAHRVAVRITAAAGEAVVEVEDNGAGMDEETQSRLFTTFFTTKGHSGTGLGLLVAHKVATEHGGMISAKAAPGQGAVFTVRLPLNKENAREEDPHRG